MQVLLPVLGVLAADQVVLEAGVVDLVVGESFAAVQLVVAVLFTPRVVALTCCCSWQAFDLLVEVVVWSPARSVPRWRVRWCARW